MDNRKTSNMFHRFWKWAQRKCNDDDQTGSQRTQVDPDGFTSESRILDTQRAKRDALIEHAERLCNMEKARNDAVLERLGLSRQDVTQPSPPPPAACRGNPKSSLHRRGRLSPLRNAPRLNAEHLNRHQRSPESQYEEDSFWDEVLLGSHMAVHAFKEAQMADRDQSPTASISSVYSLSSVDTHTPSELRELSLMGNPVEVTPLRPTPPPPRTTPLTRRRVSRLPVPSFAAGKEATKKVEAIVESLERFQLSSILSPRPPATTKKIPAVVKTAARKIPAVVPAVAKKTCDPAVEPNSQPQGSSTMAPLAPTPRKGPQNKKRGSRPGKILHHAKAFSGTGKKTTSDCSRQTVKDENDDFQPLSNPVESLSLSFQLLSSDDWMKKMEGLKTLRVLVRHHPEILKTKLHKVCLVLIEEVKNLRSAVSCAAMNTLGDLYLHLQKIMDPEVEGTGRALLLKLAQTKNAFIHQQANLALDAMVENCSYGRTLSALLNTGLSHLCVAVRGSMAQHLHQLVDRCGTSHIFTSGRIFTERFFTAVSKMFVDCAPEVRHHGQIILQELVLHEDFLNLWTKIVPEKDRSALDKILKAKK